MSKTSLKALTTQNVSGLPRHNDFNEDNLKVSYKLSLLNYMYNYRKFCNTFIFSFYCKTESKFFINNSFKLTHNIDIKKNYLNIKNMYTSFNNKTTNKFNFVNKQLHSYSFFFYRYLHDKFSIKSKKIFLKKISFKNLKKKNYNEFVYAGEEIAREISSVKIYNRNYRVWKSKKQLLAIFKKKQWFTRKIRRIKKRNKVVRIFLLKKKLLTF